MAGNDAPTILRLRYIAICLGLAYLLCLLSDKIRFAAT